VVGESGVWDASAVLASWCHVPARVLLKQVLNLGVGKIWAMAFQKSHDSSGMWARHGCSGQDSVGVVRSVIGRVDV